MSWSSKVKQRSMVALLTVIRLLTSKMWNKNNFQVAWTILKNHICKIDKSGCNLAQLKTLH